MSGELDAAGDVMTGAIIARTVESGRGAGSEYDAGACLNCGTPLTGPYCYACGQHVHVHRTLTAIWHDIAHGVFHFEGKVWRTLPMLAWRPGELTRRYVHGQRARFVSPLALFLFSVFLMFAVFESAGGPFRLNGGQNMTATDLGGELAKGKAKVTKLEAERATAIATGRPVTKIDKALADVRGDVEGLTAATLLMNGDSAVLPTSVKIETGSKAFDEQVRTALKNPKLLLYKLQSSAYKFAWALIPMSLPFMWALFAWRRQYKLYDHAVFVTYSLSFVMLLLVAMALLASAGVGTAWAMLLVPVHFFRQLKQAYQLSAFGALWRTVVLLIVTTIVLLVFGITLLALGLSV